MSDTRTRQPRSPALRPAFIASAVVIALIAVAALILAVTGSGRDDPERAPTALPPTSTGATTGSSDSACGLPNGTQRVLTTPPPTTWALVGRIATPRMKQFGPGRAADQTHFCFSHGAEGALFAAANLSSDIAAAMADRTATLRVVSQRIAPGPGKDEALRIGGQETSSPDGNDTRVQYAGFRFDNYSPDRATLQIVLRGSTGAAAQEVLVAVTYTMLWQDGDWKAELPVSGQSNSTPLTSLDGYVAWSGV